MLRQCIAIAVSFACSLSLSACNDNTSGVFNDTPGESILASFASFGTVPSPVDHHSTFISQKDGVASLNVFSGLRAVNGAVQEFHHKILSAEILRNGTLGSWNVRKEMPFGLGFHSQTQIGNRVYLAGGVIQDTNGVGGSPLSLMYDSDTNEVKEGKRYPDLAIHPTMENLDGRLYMIGGDRADHNPSVRVMTAALAMDGTNLDWESAPDLPKPLSHHSTVAFGGRIYVMGGLTLKSKSNPVIYRSVHDAAGTLSGWEIAGSFPEAPWTASALVMDGNIIVVGGGQNDETDAPAYMVARVRSARFLENGMVSDWSDIGALPMARAHVHQTPQYAGRIYSVGGRDSNLTTIDQVSIGTVTDL